MAHQNTVQMSIRSQESEEWKLQYQTNKADNLQVSCWQNCSMWKHIQ